MGIRIGGPTVPGPIIMPMGGGGPMAKFGGIGPIIDGPRIPGPLTSGDGIPGGPPICGGGTPGGPAIPGGGIPGTGLTGGPIVGPGVSSLIPVGTHPGLSFIH